jgi:flagellar biosynthetic protein FliR
MNEALPLAALGVLLVRPGAFVLATPIFGGQFVPQPIRLALTVILAVLMFPAVTLPEPQSYAGVARIVAAEMIVGLALALAIRVLVAGAELAGYVAGFQIGFSYAALVDPQTGARNNVVALLYGSMATVAFLGVNGHHALLRALARSYEALPPGAWTLDGLSGLAVTRMLGLVFIIGAQLAMPIVAVLFIVEVGLGLASRAAPSLNLMSLGFSLRLIFGLIVLALVIQVVPGAVVRYAPAALEAALRLVWGPR